MSETRFSRRLLLQGATGALLGLPFLSSLAPRAHAQETPKRLVLIYTPNGTLPEQFWPEATSGSTSYTMGPIIAPLAAHQSKVSLLKGLNLAVGKIGPGGPHQKGIGGLFTGRELLTGTFADGCGSMAGFAAGISVDQEVASKLKAPTRFQSLEFGVRCTKSDVQSRIAYSGANQPLPPMTSPAAAFDRLFTQGAARPNTPASSGDARKRSILDTLRAQLGHVQARVSSEDRAVLDRHVTLVRDLERRLGLVQAAGCMQPDAPPELAEESEQTMEQLAELQVDLLAASFTCDFTRIASLQFSDGYNRIRMPWVGSDGEGHSLSHSGTSDTGARKQLLARGVWYASMVARLLERLDNTPEGNGTMLDNTLVLWGNEIGEGSSHTHVDLPFVLAGNVGGAINTGRFYNFGGRSHNDLLLTILHAMGIEADSFGHPEYVKGPLTELLASQ